MKKYLILALVGLLSIACKQSEIQPDPNTWPAGEPIEVALSLEPDQTQTVSRAQQQTTQGQGNGFKIEIATAPINHSTSKATDEFNTANIWVLQFDGADPTAVLRYKHYIPIYAIGTPIKLLSSTTDNRVVVVANSFDADWAKDFSVGSTTWATVNAASKTVATQNDILPSDGTTAYLPMTGTVVQTLATGSNLRIPLTRTLVKVVVRIKSGEDLKITTMRIQLCGAPNPASWFPKSTGIWPASTTTIDYPEEQITGITTTDFVTHTFWVPVNRRGTVPGTTGLTRVTNAPLGATYMKVHAGTWDYTVHFGADFDTDYNLNANTEYTYSLLFDTDMTSTDSRAEDLLLVGQFGGALVKNASGEWQYTHRLFVSGADEGSEMEWANTGSAGATTLLELDPGAANGKTKTWVINKGHATLASTETYPAANACYKKKYTRWPSATSATDPEYFWFLPGQDQLLATWLAYSALSTATSFDNNYWSASEQDATKALVVNLATGSVTENDKTQTTSIWARCVREAI